VVTPIIGEQRVRERVGLIEHHRLHSSGTDIKTYTQRLCAVRFGHGFCCFNHVSTSIVLSAGLHSMAGMEAPTPGYPIM
jgi:hypothetical protein